jgi:hypothetical protein
MTEKKQQHILTLDHMFPFAVTVTVLCFACSVFHVCVSRRKIFFVGHGVARRGDVMIKQEH